MNAAQLSGAKKGAAAFRQPEKKWKQMQLKTLNQLPNVLDKYFTRVGK